MMFALAACGGDEEAPTESSGGSAGGALKAPQQETTAGATPTTETAETSGTDEAEPTTPASGEDAEAISDTIRTWLTEGGCELMTDKFLESQAFVGDSREERCKYLEDSFQKPQYGKDDIVVKEIKIDGDSASAVVGDNFSNVEADYELVRSDGRWQIDEAL